MLSFYGGVVLYNPTQNDIQNVINHIQVFDKVIVYDNSDNDGNEKYFVEADGWIYHRPGKNNGISKAINYMIDLCRENGINFLCTLDQDSVFDEKNVKIIKQWINEVCDKNVGIYAPRISYLHKKRKVEAKGIDERDWVITSGNFINIDLISSKNIRYDENYFIDRCDRDFCMQLDKANLKILVNNEAVLFQSLGTIEANGKMGHNALRHYYCFRNRLYYNNKYYVGIEKWARNIWQTIRQFKSILFKESDKLNKAKMFFKAVDDYRKGIMGMYER